MLQLFDHLRTEVNEGWNLIQHKKRKNIKKFSEKKISAFPFVYSRRNTEKDNYKDLVSWTELKKCELCSGGGGVCRLCHADLGLFVTFVHYKVLNLKDLRLQTFTLRSSSWRTLQHI